MSRRVRCDTASAVPGARRRCSHMSRRVRCDTASAVPGASCRPPHLRTPKTPRRLVTHPRPASLLAPSRWLSLVRVVAACRMVFSWGTIGGHRADLGGRCECPEVASRVTAGFSFGDSAETIASSWSATVSQSGQKVSTSNASYDGAIPAGGSVTWGMVAGGGNQALSGLSCAIS
jgi:Cellulose binding domain